MQSLTQLIDSSRHQRVHPQKKRRHATVVFIAIVLLAVAFVLLFLVSVSLPIIKAVYILALQAKGVEDLLPTDVGTEVRFGVWGYCATSVLNQPTFLTNGGECTSPRLGYVVDEAIVELVGEPQLLDIALDTLTFILVLHPIAAALCFGTLVAAFFSRIHGVAVLALVLSIVTALLTTVSCAIDTAIVAVAISNVSLLEPQFAFEVHWGNAPWMSLIATLMIWTAVVLFSSVICGCCGVTRGLWIRYDKPADVEKAI